jgi:hypothetical protein
MATVLTVSAGGVPPGSYLAVFTGGEPTSNEYGDGLRWQFEVLTGPFKGGKTSRTTTRIPTTKNSCGKMLSGLAGKPLAPGEDHDIESFIGKKYLIVVTTTDSGGTRVDSVSPPPVE